MLDLGGIYPAALNLFDPAGNPVNATTITLVITLPDATTSSPVVVNPPPVTGQYSFAYTTTQPGRHQVRWQTIGPTTAYTDVFDVAEAAPPSILSLAMAKRQLGMRPEYTDDDEELRERIAATTAQMEKYMHEAIVMRTVTEEHQFGDMFGRSWPFRSSLRLWTVPVISLTSVATTDASTTWNVADLDLDKDTGLVKVVRGQPFAGLVNSVHVAGYRQIPWNYLEAGLVLLQHGWETRRGPGGSSGLIGPEELSDWRHFTSFPRKAMELLGPPRPVVA